jgi:hypothetical protein
LLDVSLQVKGVNLASQLIGNATQRAQLKAKAIAKLPSGVFEKGPLRIEIQSIKEIDGGVEVLARAWKGGKQLGFGDGSVDIERFRIFNPPILVEDPEGEVVRDIFNPETRQNEEWRYREDLAEALRQTLAHTISLVGKTGNIVPGTVGNTTSTFHPDANPESSSVDGFIEHYSNIGFANQIAASAGTGANDSGTSINGIQSTPDGPSYRNIQRGVTLFNTAAIATDEVTSAVASLYGQFKGNTDSDSIRLVTCTPASNTALSTDDWDQFGTTAKASDMTLTSFATGAYNDFTITDLSIISKAGVTKLGWRLVKEIAGTEPTGSNYAQCASADTSGTTSDPKLVVVHAAAAATSKNLLLLGIG